MPKQADHEERRKAISRAVCHVVSESGLKGLALGAVAGAAGCTTGMVSHFFSDKKMLPAYARAEIHRRMAARTDTPPAVAGGRDTLCAVAEQALPWTVNAVWKRHPVPVPAHRLP